MFSLGVPGLSTTSSCLALYFKDLLLVLSRVVTQIQFGYVIGSSWRSHEGCKLETSRIKMPYGRTSAIPPGDNQ